MIHEDRRDDPLDAFLADARDEIEDRVRVSAATGPDPGLEDFLADARTEIETRVAERRMAPVPALRRRPRVRDATWAPLGVAAAIAIAIAGSWSLHRAREIGDVGEAPATGGALAAHAEGQEAALRRATGRIDAPVPAGETVAPLDRAVDATAVETEASPVRERRRLVAAARSQRIQAPVAETPDPESELRALDAEAQRLWRSGDLAGAEGGFRTLLARAGDGRWSELAWGDLLAIARQRGDGSGQVALWREYLRAHPRGRHAEDARAGLCRREDDPSDCWRQYLADFPEGVYREQARAGLHGAR